MSEQLPGIELFLTSGKAVAEADKFRTAVESCASAVERIGVVAESMQKLLDQFGKSSSTSIKKVGEEAEKTEEAFDHYGSAAKIAGKQVKDSGDAAAKAGDRMREGAAGVAALDTRLGGLGRTSISIGRALTTLLGAAGAISGIAAGISTISDYEDKLQILGTIAGATSSQLRSLEEASVELSKNSRFTPREALQGLTELARAGLSAQDAMTALKPTADLARVGLVSLAESSGIVSKTLTQFGLSANEAGRVADVLATAANSSNASVETLAHSLAKTGPVAKQYGVSLEDTVAALAKIADNGLAANIAGTGLQRVLIQLRSPTEEAQRALLGLGLTAAQINPEKVGLVGALRNLANVNVTVQDSVALVGTEFASLLTILTGSVDGIDKVGGALRNSTGEAAKQAAAGADTLAASFAQLRSASEEFAVSTGRGGIGGALKAITSTGAEVLRILADDKKAMDDASFASKAFATGLQLAAVGGTAFAAAKIAKTIEETVVWVNRATAATVTYEAATGTAAVTAGRAAKAFAALSAIIRANPYIAAAAALAGIVSAFYVFGSSSDDASAKAKKQSEALKELQDQYLALQKVIGGVTQASSQFSDASDQVAAFRRARDELQKLGKDLESAKTQQVPVERLLGLADLAGAESQIGKIKTLIESIPNVRQRIAEGFDRFVGFGRQKEFEDQLTALGVVAEKALGATIYSGDQVDVGRQRFIKIADAVRLVQEALANLDKRAGDKGIALPGVGDANKLSEISSTVRSIIAERQRELDIATLSGVEREKALLIAEAEKRSGQGVTEAEREKLTALAQQTIEMQKLVDVRRHDEELARAAAKQQQDLPKHLAELQTEYTDQLRIAEETGLQRELIRADVEAENDAKQIGLALDSDELAKLKEKARETARLLYEEKQAKKETRVDKRQDDATRKLDQEEEALRKTGDERDKYTQRIEAENEARQAGLVLGSKEFADYVRRKVAVLQLTEAQKKLAELGGQVGDAIGGALERIAIDGERARDVMADLAKEIERIAFRQLVTQNISKIFSAGAVSLFGGAPTSATGAGSGSFPGMTGSGGWEPRMLGGVIPALAGQVVDEFSYMRRGGRTYSRAEGGATTPEAIVPLERNERGRLGVALVGGGGGDTIHMSFPSVRSAQDARAVRATMGQKLRSLRAADRTGRRGLRPRD